MVRTRHVEVFPGDDGQWYFRLRHANGRKGDRSTTPYSTKWSAKRGASRAHAGLRIVER
jgi:hypothetical protein